MPRRTRPACRYGASLSNPYNDFVGGAPFPYNGSYATGGGILGVSQDFEWAHAYQTNVGVQRQIGRRWPSAPPTSGRSAATCRSGAT